MVSTKLFLVFSAAVFASVAYAKVIGRSGERKFVASDLTGEFELFVEQGSCPKTILHKGFIGVSRGAYKVDHDKIMQDGTACTGDGYMTVVSEKAIDNAEKNVKEALKSGPLAEIITALEDQNAEFMVGYELEKRDCGGTSVSADTGFIFVEDKKKIKVPGVNDLSPGAKYMIYYDSTSPNPCAYTAVSSDSVVGEAAPSPKPINAKPASASGDIRDDGLSPLVDGSAEPESNDGSVCFPGDATVTLENGKQVRMDEVKIGDSVSVGGGKFSQVFMFTHRINSQSTKFIQLQTASGHSIQLTPGHFIYANGQLKTADKIVLGDNLTLGNGGVSNVIAISSMTKSGIYNPQTTHGDIVVDGVRASTFTETIYPDAAQSMLAPLRAAFKSVGTSCTAFENGAGIFKHIIAKIQAAKN